MMPEQTKVDQGVIVRKFIKDATDLDIESFVLALFCMHTIINETEKADEMREIFQRGKTLSNKEDNHART